MPSVSSSSPGSVRRRGKLFKNKITNSKQATNFPVTNFHEVRSSYSYNNNQEFCESNNLSSSNFYAGKEIYRNQYHNTGSNYNPSYSPNFHDSSNNKRLLRGLLNRHENNFDNMTSTR